MSRASLVGYGVAAAASASMWCGIALAFGELEAWDHPLYFQVGLPCLAAVVFGLGYAVPVRPWRWGLAAGATQVVSAFVLHPALGPLAPLGLIFFGVITGTLAVVAALGSVFSSSSSHGHAG